MSENLSVYTFGGLRILEAGEPLGGIDSRKEEALFTYLALAERPQPREILAELLWDDRSQQQAQANLRRVLSGLRKHFGPYVDITRGSVTMNWETDLWLDARELRNGVKTLKAETASISPQIVSKVDEALRLYHGEFLAGFHVRGARNFDTWLSDQREYWRQVVLESAGGLIGVYESMQSFREGVELARWALQIDSLQESLHRQLMQLLALSGQRTDALKQYEQCRQFLVEELGVAPESETEALYEAIASGALGVTQPVVIIPGMKVEDKTQRTQHEKRSIPTNITTLTTPIVGREAELEALDGLITKPGIRLVTIVGPGGMGKTRLALAVAERLLFQERQSIKDQVGKHAFNPFRDGIFFVSLAPVSSPDNIALALAKQLEISFFGELDPFEQILEYLKRQHILLIFDNFEHLMDGVEIVASILEHAPNTTILATSRERLMISEEAILRLGGLSFPVEGSDDAENIELAETEHGSVGLFLHHARLIHPDLDDGPKTLEKVVRICQLVQGMPLAIILAVSWIETLSLDELAEAIASSVDILASQQRDLPPRQRSIRAAFENSWLRLTPMDQTVFAKLSEFRGGFTRKAAESVAGADLFILRTLIEKSLIVPLSSDRYELHELLRQFAEEKLVDSGEMDSVVQAHAEFYLNELASLEADVKGKRQTEAFREIGADLDNITQAWFWALNQGQFSLIDRALESLTVFCYFASRAIEGHKLFQTAREKLVVETNEKLLGRLLARHAWLKSEYGIAAESIEADLDRSRAISKQLEDQRELAQTLLAKGFFMIRIRADRAAGLLAFEPAYQIFQANDNRFYMSLLLGRIGFCQEDPYSMLDFIHQGLLLALEIGNDYEAIIAQTNFGGMSNIMGDSVTGMKNLHQALATANRIGFSSRHYFITNALSLEGFLRGDLEQMKRYLPPQEDIIIGKVSPNIIAYTLATKALLAVVNGDFETAGHLAHQSLAYSGITDVEVLALWALAMVNIDLDNLAEASQQLSVAYGKPNITRYPGMMTRSLPVAALILAKQNHPSRAAQVLSLATNHPASQIGWLQHWTIGATLRSELEKTLGKKAFQEDWNQGETLDLAEIVTLLSELFKEPR